MELKLPHNLSMERYAPLLALAVLVVLSELLYPRFLEPQNLLNILRQVSYTGIIALGMTLVIIAGGIDLSVGSMTALAGACAVLTLNALTPETPVEGVAVLVPLAGALLAALAVGASAGLLNGFLITTGRITPFIATLGTMAVFRSLTLYLGNASEFRSNNSLYGDMGMGSVFLVPLPVWVFLGAALILSVVLHRTRFGRYTRAVGSNARVSQYSAINVDGVKLSTYVIVGVLVALTAFLISARLNSISSTNAGKDYEMDAIAAVVIGGTAMTGGRGAVWGTVIGAVILGIINNMMNMLGVSPYLQGLVKGSVIIAAVFIQRGDLFRKKN